jgi:hypothetical protein
MPSSTPEPEGPTLAEKVAAAMSEAAEVTKSSRNTEQGYNFASAEAILAAVRAPLLKRGVLLIPSEGQYETEEIQARSGAKGQRVTVTVTFRFTDGRDELLIPGWRGVGQDYGDKAAGKAYTNALKTLIRTAWLLPTEHDDPERSSPGENVGASPAELPKWARKTERPEAWLAALERHVGSASSLAAWQGMENALGYVPDVAIQVARLIAGLLDRAQAEDAAHEPTEPPPSDDEGGVTLEEARRLAERPGPGTVKAPENLSPDPAKATAELKAAGCSCPSPIAAQHEAEGDGPVAPEDVDKGCAIHGIPF